MIGGHVIKLGPGNDEAAKEALAAWPGPFRKRGKLLFLIHLSLADALQIGGGINEQNAAEWLQNGASKVRRLMSIIFSGGSSRSTGYRDILPVPISSFFPGKVEMSVDVSRKGEACCRH